MCLHSNIYFHFPLSCLIHDAPTFALKDHSGFSRDHLSVWFIDFSDFKVLPSRPTSRRPARGLKGLNMAPRALIHTGMGRSGSDLSELSGKPQGSTKIMCFTLHSRDKTHRNNNNKTHIYDELFFLYNLSFLTSSHRPKIW